MLRVLYTIGLHLFALGALARFVFYPKGRPLATWFGWGAPRVVEGSPVVWIHAVSVGEVRAISALAGRLRKRWPQGVLVISTTTATGQQEAKRSISEADHWFYLPLDLPWIVRPIIRRLSPDLVLISETDLWYHALHEAKRCGAHIHLVNGKISSRSARRWVRFRPLSSLLYRLFDGVCAQDQEHRRRFLSCGLTSKAVHVTGNLKFDGLEVAHGSGERVRARLRIDRTEPTVVLASTHHPEEELLLERLLSISGVKFLFVPRHPERFASVARLLAASGALWGRWSQPERLTGEESVLLVDAMGELGGCYQLASLAIVGGSFTNRVGGHNIIEPLMGEAPVLFGPYMHAQQAMQELVLEARAGLQVELDAVAQAVGRLLGNQNARLEMVAGGQEVLARIHGSLERTWETLPLTRIESRVKMDAQITRGGAEVSSLGS